MSGDSQINITLDLPLDHGRPLHTIRKRIDIGGHIYYVLIRANFKKS